MDKIALEKQVFELLTHIYCKGVHKGEVPCTKCSEIISYAHKRVEACRFGDEKGFCSKCTVHCFKPDMRQEVKKIMRYSGPRMLLYHPVLAIRHYLLG